jgi:RNA polymerase sigma factor (sigma-70 family)
MSDRSEAMRRSHYGDVYRYVRRRTRSREDAEDITQTVFAEAVAGLERSSATSPPVLAWLYTVARRRLIDERRRRSARLVPLDEARLPARDAYGVDVAGALARAITGLPKEQQRVVVLKLVEGRAFAEIAATLEINEDACRARLARALRTLRTHLEQEGMRP